VYTSLAGELWPRGEQIFNEYERSDFLSSFPRSYEENQLSWFCNFNSLAANIWLHNRLGYAAGENLANFEIIVDKSTSFIGTIHIVVRIVSKDYRALLTLIDATPNSFVRVDISR
jgi:hypothetical protein